jgi:hypothetical protein
MSTNIQLPGFRVRKPRPQVAQSDPLKVASVKKLCHLARRKNVELWSFSNTACVVAGVPPANKDSILLPALTRKSVVCFRAVNLRTGQFMRRICKAFNAETLQRFVKQLLRR